MLDSTLVVKSGSVLDYQISRVSEDGIQGTLFSGSVAGIVGSIDNFEFYIHDTDANSGPNNNLYFNRLEVVSIPEFADSEKVSIPEPGRFGLLLGFGAVIVLGTRRRRVVELLNAVLLPNL